MANDGFGLAAVVELVWRWAPPLEIGALRVQGRVVLVAGVVVVQAGWLVTCWPIWQRDF